MKASQTFSAFSVLRPLALHVSLCPVTARDRSPLFLSLRHMPQGCSSLLFRLSLSQDVLSLTRAGIRLLLPAHQGCQQKIGGIWCKKRYLPGRQNVRQALRNHGVGLLAQQLF
jgi:hypothetical protein